MKYEKPRLNKLNIQPAAGGCTSGSRASGNCSLGNSPSNKCSGGTAPPK